MAKVIGVDKAGVANEVGVEIGDYLVAFNNQPLIDMLDYYYYDQEENFSMTILRDEVDHVIEIEKEEWESLGMDLDDSLDIQPIRCKNKCKFCFVDQLPKGMRDTLYLKDDDYRLSFLAGNYITLTNVGEAEIERILRLRISPLYISIHATDPKVKVELVANGEAAKTFDKVKRLAEGRIVMHAQIVMCPTINDGKVLEQSLDDLLALKPSIASVAVVPLGMTGHREGLAKLIPVDEAVARDAIELIAKVNKKCGDAWAFASDEMYLKANIELPPSDYYGDYDQIENGVGLIRKFESEIDEALADIAPNDKKIAITCLTGVSFSPILIENLKRIKTAYKGLSFEVLTIVNDFFGHSITVAGLITAGDIIRQCKGKTEKNVIIPSNMLREFETVFLDGITLDELSKELNATIHVCADGYRLVEIVNKMTERR